MKYRFTRRNKIAVTSTSFHDVTAEIADPLPFEKFLLALKPRREVYKIDPSTRGLGRAGKNWENGGENGQGGLPGTDKRKIRRARTCRYAGETRGRPRRRSGRGTEAGNSRARRRLPGTKFRNTSAKSAPRPSDISIRPACRAREYNPRARATDVPAIVVGPAESAAERRATFERAYRASSLTSTFTPRRIARCHEISSSDFHSAHPPRRIRGVGRRLDDVSNERAPENTISRSAREISRCDEATTARNSADSGREETRARERRADCEIDITHVIHVVSSVYARVSERTKGGV